MLLFKKSIEKPGRLLAVVTPDKCLINFLMFKGSVGQGSSGSLEKKVFKVLRPYSSCLAGFASVIGLAIEAFDPLA